MAQKHIAGLFPQGEPQRTANTSATASGSRSFAVPPAEAAAQRLDRFLAACLKNDGISREKVKRLIREGKVLVDETIVTAPAHALPAHSLVTAFLSPEHAVLAPEEGEITVLYRDACLAVLEKPAGLTVHPAPSCPSGTLAHRLVAHFPELAAMEGFRPGIVHRLDKDTSGLLLVALEERARLALTAMFAAHEVEKEYLALAHGVPERREGSLSAPMARHPRVKTMMSVQTGGKEALSAWRTLFEDPDGRFSLLAVRITTGRTHQIRVHMAHLGHPLLGDALYGKGIKTPLPFDPAHRQMLHAFRLSFRHPFPEHLVPTPDEPDAGVSMQGDRLSIVSAPPEDFSATAAALGLGMVRTVITGSPGCGKSSLLAALARKGVPVFSADAEVKAQYDPGGQGREILLARYQERFVPRPEGPVDKIALAEAMRQSPAFKREVEDILHPLVRHAMETFWQRHEALGAGVALAEIPLYLEAGFKTPSPVGFTALLAPEKDQPVPDTENTGREAPPASLLAPVLVGVHCPFALRRERLMEKRGWSEEVIASMESWQWPEDLKMAACDVVVPNTGTEEDLEKEAEKLHDTLQRFRALRSKQFVLALNKAVLELSGRGRPS